MSHTTTPIHGHATTDLARTGTQGLAVRSATLVRRGLRDLARESNWLIQKVFNAPVSHAAISSDGHFCIPNGPSHENTQGLSVLDLENSSQLLPLGVPLQGPLAKLAWAPGTRHLIAAGDAPSHDLRVIDVRRKNLAGSLRSTGGTPSSIAWSPGGALVASALTGKEPSLALWQIPERFTDAPAEPLHRLGAPNWIERQSDEADSADAGEFSGYGSLAFSPDEALLAVVVQIGGDWADDSIALLNARTLEKETVFEAQGHVTDIAWSGDGKRVVYCSAGQAYGIDVLSAESTSLPFGGERCAWHPHLPVCLFYSSWLRNSAKGRLFLADMDRGRVFDEHPADNILDLRWSADGSKAYAIASEGLAYIYEPELL